MTVLSDLSEQISSAMGGRAAKRAYRDQRKAEKRAWRAARLREIKCFWSLPLRHEFAPLDTEDRYSPRRCVGCGKSY